MSHCSTCAACIYKLDHHCVWAQTCIGYRNQKAFYLFTFYMSLGLWIFWYETYYTFHALKHPVKPDNILTENWNAPQFFDVFEWYVYILWGVTCLSASLIGLMIVALWFSHTVMILTNFTTLDSMKKRRCFPIPFFEFR